MIGRTVSHYRILEKLGEGGMGVVYKAEDTRLGRTVALKFLPDALARDRQALDRFDREARAVSSLSHPNLVTLFDVGESEGQPFFAMELLEGESLHRRMAGKPITPAELVEVAIQVTDALAAAHSKGVIHRDIKPANLFLTAQGHVKVLDFGIAKVSAHAAQAAGQQDATVAMTGPLTHPGSAVGTVAYMSPEQALGQDLDARTDLFSLGVVLYEMACGRLPFSGSTTAATFDAILHKQPTPPIRINPELPPELDAILHKSLEKDRELRYQTASDFRADLKRLHRTVSGSVPTAVAQVSRPVPSRSRRIAMLAAGAVLVLAVGGWGLVRVFGGHRAASGPIEVTALTTAGNAFNPVLSPDGKYVAYTGLEKGLQSLWMLHVATKSNVQLVPPSDNTYFPMVFSPDGNYVYYVAAPRGSELHALYQLPALGGTPKQILSDVDTKITFAPDGKRFAFVRGSLEHDDEDLMVADADGGNVHSIAHFKHPDRFTSPDWSPDGKTIAGFLRLPEKPGATMVFVPASGGAPKRVPYPRLRDFGQLRWLADSKTLVTSGFGRRQDEAGQIWIARMAANDVQRVTRDLNDYRSVSVTADSSALATVQISAIHHIWLVPQGEGAQPRQITNSQGTWDGANGVVGAPDGSILYTSFTNGASQLWSVRPEGAPRALGVDAPVYDPRVCGRYIVYSSWRQDAANLWRTDLDGSNPTQLSSGGDDGYPACAANPEWVYYMSHRSVRKTRLSGGESVEVVPARSNPEPVVVSPDGRRILTHMVLPNTDSVQAVLLDADGRPVKVLGPHIRIPQAFTPDGRGIVHPDRSGFNLVMQPIEGDAPAKPLTQFTAEHIYSFAWSPDGQLIISRAIVSNNVVLIRNFW